MKFALDWLPRGVNWSLVLVGSLAAVLVGCQGPNYPSANPNQSALALERLNGLRQQCGLTALRENQYLDLAASAHVTYVRAHGITHIENPRARDYYGLTPNDRAIKAGYQSASTVGEVVTTDTPGGGAGQIDGLISVPYHAVVLMTPADVDVGIGITAAAEVARLDTVIDLGIGPVVTTFGQVPLTFPCQGAVDVPYQSLGHEYPEPLGIDTSVDPLGTPIVVVGNLTDHLTLTGGFVTAPDQITTNLTLLDSVHDANHELMPYHGVAFPPAPLHPDTTYTVYLVGTINDQVFTRNFRFTTSSLELPQVPWQRFLGPRSPRQVEVSLVVYLVLVGLAFGWRRGRRS